jgi:RNA polymerase-binding transcription factor DksA
LSDGPFGRCEHCGNMIESARLTLTPHVRSCATCKGHG